MKRFFVTPELSAIFRTLYNKRPNSYLLECLVSNMLPIGEDLCGLTTEQATIDFLAVSSEKPEFISYLQVTKMPEVGTSVWDAKKRFHGKPAKTVAKLNTFPQVELEEFAQLFFAHQTKTADKYTFSLVSGDELIKYYNEKTYPEGATLNSCMRYNECRHYLQVYAHNPEQVKLAILLNEDGELVARAIVWIGLNINGAPSDVPCIDRVYFYDGEAKTALEKYTEAFTNIYDASERLTIGLANYTFDQWPYIDTLYYSDDCGQFSNYNNGDYCYRETDGSREGDRHTCTCAECGGGMDEDDSTYIDNVGSCCNDCVVYVERSGECALRRYCCNLHNGDWANITDCTWIDGDWYLNSELITTSDDNLIREDDCVCTEDGNVWHQDQEGETFIYFDGDAYDVDGDNICTLHNGDYWHVSDVVEYDGANYKRADCVETSDGDVFPAHLSALYYTDADGTIFTSQLKLAFA